MLVTSHAALWLDGAERIRLDGMADADMLALLGDRLGAPPDTRAVEACRPVLDLANGNPLVS